MVGLQKSDLLELLKQYDDPNEQIMASQNTSLNQNSAALEMNNKSNKNFQSHSSVQQASIDDKVDPLTNRESANFVV